jgi:hypothetical protein
MKTKRKPRLFRAEHNGKPVNVTVPAKPDEVENLHSAIQDCISPHAVAAVISCLRINRSNDASVDGEVHWFAEELVKMLGGYEEQGRLAEELGL